MFIARRQVPPVSKSIFIFQTLTPIAGLLSASEVGAAFENLLKEGQNGDVMAVWKDCPPYFIPDTSMALFIAYTTCAMMFRFTPGTML